MRNLFARPRWNIFFENFLGGENVKCFNFDCRGWRCTWRARSTPTRSSASSLTRSSTRRKWWQRFARELPSRAASNWNWNFKLAMCWLQGRGQTLLARNLTHRFGDGLPAEIRRSLPAGRQRGGQTGHGHIPHSVQLRLLLETVTQCKKRRQVFTFVVNSFNPPVCLWGR